MKRELENIFLTALTQNQQKLLRICSIYSKDSEDTKDLFQEVLVNIWQSMPNFEAKSSIGTWMFRITLNVCLRFRTKYTKRKNQFTDLDSMTIANFGSDEKNNEENEKLNSLRKCVKKLNEADRAVIALFLEELPYKEISIVTGLTENHVAVKVKRIKRKLLNCINKTL